MSLAAIDIGTNSILLLIAEQQGKMLIPLIDLAKTVRLGEGLSATGILSDRSIARTLTGLVAYEKQLQLFSPDPVICFGTAALRMAENAQAFQNQVQEQFRWTVQILSEKEEAFYTFQGALSSIPYNNMPSQTDIVAIDIGGGSTEVIYGTQQGIRLNNFHHYLVQPIDRLL